MLPPFRELICFPLFLIMCLQKLCLLQAQNLIWQKVEAAAVPQLCLHLHPTVELKLLFFPVRSSASACGISTDNSDTWQGITLLSHLTASAAMHCFFSGRGPTVESQSTCFLATITTTKQMSAMSKRWKLDWLYLSHRKAKFTFVLKNKT